MKQLLPDSLPADYLAGRNILITGAGKGIGAALARACARLGAEVLLLGRSLPSLESVYDEIQAEGGRSAIYVLDLETAGPDEYNRLTQLLDEQCGRLDGLVMNAGLLGDRVPLQTYPIETWYRVMQVNLNSNFILAQYLLPLLMKAPDASLLFTSSGVGRKGRAYWGAYAVSKAAVEGLSQVLADELANTSRVRVNTINPGATRTAMRAAARPGEDPTSLPEPKDILPLYLYLLGPLGKGVNGESLDAQAFLN